MQVNMFGGLVVGKEGSLHGKYNTGGGDRGITEVGTVRWWIRVQRRAQFLVDNGTYP